jgi:hypothetical protein
MGAMGISQLFLGLVRSGRGNDISQNILLGVVGLALAYMLFNVAWLKVHERYVEVGGAFGIGGRKYEYGSLDDLAMDEKSLLVRSGISWKTIAPGKSLARSEDWALLEKYVNSKKAG